MRRDLVVQVIVQYDDFWENFATPFEAESFINSNLDKLDLPVMVRLEDMKGKTAYFGGINKCKFRRKVAPGDKLRLETKIIRRKGPVGIGSAVASVDGEVAVEAELTFMIG